MIHCVVSPPTEPVVKSRASGSQLPFSQNARPRQARKAWWAGSWSDPLSGCYPWDEESWCTQAIRPKEVLLVPRRQGRIFRVNLGKRWRQQGCCYGGTWGKINNAKNSIFKIWKDVFWGSQPSKSAFFLEKNLQVWRGWPNQPSKVWEVRGYG